ncbi:MAG: putative MarR-family transcriptional regulator [Jatrophihabitans sp.]|jgi:DNA-binding MarR family transcriptional regulator|nr:putative MarR-family transcriptional regulator [Jatrophihabitans sp.]
MSTRLADARALAVGVDRLVSWLRRQTPATVSSSTITALDRLRVEGPLRVSELAVREGMTQPGVTMLVNRLADAGYAERVADPTDRRAALVRVTAAGEAVLTDRQTVRAELLRERLAELSDDDQRLLSAALPAIERLVATGPRTTVSRKPRA